MSKDWGIKWGLRKEEEEDALTIAARFHARDISAVGDDVHLGLFTACMMRMGAV